MEVKFEFFLKWLQPVERSRKRLKKTYEVKFFFMHKEISYIRLKKRKWIHYKLFEFISLQNLYFTLISSIQLNILL